MPKTDLRVILCIFAGMVLFSPGVFPAPEDNPSGEEEISRGSIPEELLRPQRGEAPRYPVDTVIGALGRGEASEGAYLFARKVSAALTAGNQNDPSLSGMNGVLLEAFISELNGISPRSYRLGSGREEPDGAVSFLVRFLGREQGITGELYIRPQGFEPPEDPPPPETAARTGEAEQAEGAPPEEEGGRTETAAQKGNPAYEGPVVWLFEDLILEEARERETEEDASRFDFPPYERFF
jgi:hypothetical protein